MTSAICLLLQLYSLVVIARIVLEYIPVSYDHPVAKIRSLFRRLTDPVLLPLRRILPPVRIGGMGLDLSPLVLLIGLRIIISAIC